MHQFMVWIQIMQLKTLWTCISYDNNKLTPNFCEAQTYRHKKTCRKKVKPFVNLIFHGLLWKNLKFLNHSQWNV